MDTKSVKVEREAGSGFTAVITAILPDTQECVEYRIRRPRSRNPYFMVDGARHDLKKNEIKALRQAMEEVGL